MTLFRRILRHQRIEISKIIKHSFPETFLYPPLSSCSMTKQRLDSLIRHDATVQSISTARAVIRTGKVTVDGIVCRTPELQLNPEKKKVLLNGKALHKEAFRYFLLHKPAWHSCQQNERFPFVGALIPVKGIYPVGRLDVQTTGLLILTNDGKLSSLITSPQHKVRKTYKVMLNKAITPASLRVLKNGVAILVADKKVTVKAENIKTITPTIITLQITEGKKRQVRLMLQAVGYGVVALQRIAIGMLSLETLKEGQWKEVSKEFILKSAQSF